MRVTSPRMSAAVARPAPRPHAARDVDESTGVREVYLRSLLRVQRRLALGVLGVVALPLAAVPVLFALVPALSAYRVAGLPLPWLLLGVAVHPLLLAAAAWYVRRVERTEADFTDLLSGGDSHGHGGSRSDH
ncbi:hypothetical protein [Parafrankia sp. EUN1f]|uniref:hypothetical protein n=1 Tax=Parafrankia sp. EUN1f TaxID=102897 RepID=UPI0001C46413|nr:hypothetical protein [Parafrankia sp. EUN1f]EFC81073.1 hypothetical protein FrEUN1fDRAFT_5820 [Parafrankia sp. EUN1f]